MILIAFLLLLLTSTSFAQINIGDTVTVVKSKHAYVVKHISVTSQNKTAYELLNLKNNKRRWVLDEQLQYERKQQLNALRYRRGEEEEFENFIE
ncbi:hypothetical protein [Flammeovirga aprica]|uniref:Uncharacterized protein n=1 Tax=Flammeovirga aprica JL-4 TaxID=694437 RepID=A0A7X9XDB7_9BACT|nr:hypothetical protein [Flammeovirga aprica]NME72628.1 hypothetical protein [Flammeovirga aprica JL-4]